MIAPDPMKVLAAVSRAEKGPFTLETLQLHPPRKDEVLVRIVAVGMCHTDLAVRDGELPSPLPIVLGHEGSGVVEAVGASVTAVAPGDHVVLSYLSCGECRECASGRPAACAELGRLCFGGARPDGSHALCAQDGGALNDRFFGQSSFAEHAIAHERNVIKVSKDVPLDILGPLGCGVMTGAGAVWNALQVAPGSSFVVYGAGSVGLSAAMAARAAGATTIVCVDRVASRLALARELGATHVFEAGGDSLVTCVREATGGGADAALDTTGRADVMRTAMSGLRQCGALACVAISPAGGAHTFDMVDLVAGCKRLFGVIEGLGSAKVLIPRIIELHLDGHFPFDRLIRFYEFKDINAAAADSASGRALKPVLRLASDGL